MAISHARLDRFISEKCRISRRDVRLLLAQKRVKVDGKIADSIELIINKFSIIELDNEVLQNNRPLYIMLHKPKGVVCATKDDVHKTVLDLIEHPLKNELHIVGRLDLNTSGLVLLTNDSRWSERLMSPEFKVAKKYFVTLKNQLTPEYIDAFAQGMYFEYEDLNTLPAKLSIISPYQAEVALVEGRYHQIKRMFGRFRNPVIALHRFAIGNIQLTEKLAIGEFRELTAEEIEVSHC